MAKRKLNVELLKQIRDKIASTPDAYDQMVYGRPDHTAPCGTACCIAGWACVLSGRYSVEDIRKARDAEYVVKERISETAQELLGLSENEADTLFTAEPEGSWEDYDDDGEDAFEGGWPEPFRTEWREGIKEYNVIAARYLDQIIETGKVT